MLSPDDSSVSNIDCDFEASDICKYTQETTDDFNWVRNQHTTVSTGTGPSADHTYGTTTGQFSSRDQKRKKEKIDPQVVLSSTAVPGRWSYSWPGSKVSSPCHCTVKPV